MEWNKVATVYATEEKARRAAEIIAITESRLASHRNGPQYEVETKTEPAENGWKIAWRKVLVGFASGCGGCGSCNSQPSQQPEHKAKVIPFKKPSR